MKKITYIFFALLALCASGCNDWLDVRPKTEEPAASMFDTYQGYQDALIGCYIKMKARPVYGDHLTIRTIEYLAQYWDINTFNGRTEQDFANAVKGFQYQDDNVRPVFQGIYDGLYNIIVQANTIIEALPSTGASAIENDDARGVVEGEAYAIRAYCHLDILRLFGQVPGGTTKVRLPYTEGVSREPVTYYSFEDFTAKLESDLKRAEDALKANDPLVEGTNNEANVLADEFLRYRKLRLNYWAVKALQARFYLYIGQPDKAYAAAMTVINGAESGKGFMLDKNSMKNDFDKKYFGLPSEALFSLNNHQLKDYINTIFRGTETTSTNLYMAPDKLSDAGMFETAVDASADYRYQSLWTHEKKNMYGEICPELLTYSQADTETMSTSLLTNYKQIMPMLGMGELYLIAMETSDDIDEIRNLYETYRVSRNMLGQTFADKAEALKTIEKEYRRELIGQGQMFYYYKRHGAKTMLWKDGEIAESSYIVPLPTTEFDPNN